MVDDFQVPGDAGYQFDDYGEGKKLSLNYLNPVAHLGFTPFFPTLPSSEESGVNAGGSFWPAIRSQSINYGKSHKFENGNSRG